MKKTNAAAQSATYTLLIVLVILFIAPLLIILMNSFKGKLYISRDLFAFVNPTSFVGLHNYALGFTRMNYLRSFLTSLFITVCATGLIVLFCSMAAWYLTRVKSRLTSLLYYLFVFAMIVPFQMVMFTMSWMSNRLHLDTPIGILVLYVGFGSGMAVFMLAGFVKSIPLDIEEAASIDGASPLATFFRVVFPVMRPTAITVAILNVMWIWNDYLLPLLVLKPGYETLPVAIQKIFTGSYGGRDMGGLMAMLVLSIIPVVVFYLFSQKYIIKGVVAGAVKG